jgi:hypothetical protein
MAKTKEPAQVYQLKITLQHVRPPSWWWVQVKDGTLAEFHTPRSGSSSMPSVSRSRSAWVSPWPARPDAAFPVPLPVHEIRSVSRCIAAGPDLNMTDFNQFGCYDGPAAAWQALPEELRTNFNLFAYRLAPGLFRDGQEEPLPLPSLDVLPLADTFERLGYDAIELTQGCCLGCSPLSCNGEAEAIAVNRYCLADTEQEGIILARTFSISKPEPGPYCVVEVWREQALRPTELVQA